MTISFSDVQNNISFIYPILASACLNVHVCMIFKTLSWGRFKSTIFHIPLRDILDLLWGLEPMIGGPSFFLVERLSLVPMYSK